ncbi:MULTISPECIES: hypothetical protein [Sinorhizobium]|uniref:Uncharacterized protein n=1 Tax=Sinorhizobium americanum TaxID=194963 RepID=A0A2S3YVT7_9HYPH|nr:MULTISPECIES: hypothetical protein [Sinorhizobium]POH35750.1 hypothetical protein ATY31_00500 [Sinorhizobium americanum]
MATFEEQMAAWEEYRQAKIKADQSGDFLDARTAADAWVSFLNVYLDDDHKLPAHRGTSGNVALFPVHKTRAADVR